MTTYLTIITTLLVVTQIIRVTQNGIQLHKLERNLNGRDELDNLLRCALKKYMEEN